MRKFIVSLGLASLMLSPSTLALADDALSKAIKDIDKFTTKSLKHLGIPGAAIAIVKDGKVEFVKSYGFKTVGNKDPINNDTVFAIGSVTKNFTTAALGKLVSEGKINWDDKVKKYLPSFELNDPNVTNQMTIRDLVAQKTCIQPNNVLFWRTPITRQQVMERLKFLKSGCEFRNGFIYNNLMFVAAGEIVAEVSGISWEDYIETNFFTELGMNNSTTRTSVAAKNKNLATPHRVVDNKFVPLDLINLDSVGAGGSIHSSINNMTQWVALQLGKGTLNKKEFWNKKASQEMHRPQMLIGPDTPFTPLYPNAQFLSYGLGWYTYTQFGDRIVRHNGQTDGMVSLVSMLPEENIGIVILTNSVILGLPDAIEARFYDAYKGRKNRDWNQVYKDIYKPYNQAIDQDYVIKLIPQIKGTTPSLNMKSYAGNFHDNLLGLMTFEVSDNDEISVSLLGKKGTLGHWHHNTFLVDWQGDAMMAVAGAFITFDLNLKGDITAATLNFRTKFEKKK